DESDEMLSRGFKDQIYDVYRYLPLELQESCPFVKNILLLDSEGCRVTVKYSDDWPTNGAKEAYEKSVFTTTQKTKERTEGMLTNFVTLL
ncbi:coatomer subunit zeta-1-like protein, partial [Tanacetum coccineum]